MALQADGKIVVCGYTTSQGPEDFAVARYNANGSLDDGTANDSTPGDSFGTAGKVVTRPGTSNNAATCVAIQPDGRILVGGYARVWSSDQFVLVRYNADGTLDTGFSGDGMVTTAIETWSNAYSIALQPDGKILLAGNS